jgi:uncharacterized protein (TIGR02421 family)
VTDTTMPDTTPPPVPRISAEFIAQVLERLEGGRAVRRALPGGGRLHIDRALPFLCVYREPLNDTVGQTSQLVIGEAAHLIAPGTTELHPRLQELVAGISSIMVRKFAAFLLLEVWTAEERSAGSGATRTVPDPTFRIVSPTLPVDDPTVRELRKALGKIPLRPPPLDVEVVTAGSPAPPGLDELLSCAPGTPKGCSVDGCSVVGIEVQPVYRQARTGTPYPVLFETLQRGLSLAIRQTAYHFAQLHTGHAPRHYHALGRRSTVRAVTEADRALTEISRSFDFLLQVTPVNAERARLQFLRDGAERDPEFDYRPLIVNVPALKRRLYDLPLERLEDPTLQHLLSACRTEMSRKLTMLGDRNTARFLYGSLAVYGDVSDALHAEAIQLLEALARGGPGDEDEEDASEAQAVVNAEGFAAMAEEELSWYREAYSGLASKVQIRSDVAGVLVSDGDLLIGSDFRTTETRARALLQHEIGTHVISHSNGLAQPLGQLASGLAGYEETQEGLAVASEYLVGALTPSRVRVLAGRVVAVRALVDGAPFVDSYRLLTGEHDFAPSTAFTICMRVYRSGGLTKDAIYLRGLQGFLAYLRADRDLEPLLMGKLAIADVPAIEELRWREYLNPPRLIPRFLTAPEAEGAMRRLRQGHSLLELVTGITST